jgi:hypothetical protein
MKLAPVLPAADPGHVTACPFVRPETDDLVTPERAFAEERREVTGA